ncbi:carboxymuconolactone decarboxylase family protein [Actinomadura fibrosa]|uniref:Carboxymuconolactone decarboxylase family protein n=1 Tax=Actinomadura fibrosa TaxID=111802 RepID=A0ABW2Y2A9_9ACTN|nr:carboxymuconolactone decarboxylase family protein [Actinomadura fibrosa]
MSGLLVRATRRAAPSHVRYVRTVAPDAAEGLVARVYAQVERDFGMLAPPVALHAPAPEALAACWTLLRETLLADGRADRPAKEVVAAAVSLANACPYCVDVHGAVLHALIGRNAAALLRDRPAAATDPRLRGIARWARDGAPPPGTVPSEHGAELLGVALAFHYLNRMVNVFLRDSPFPARTPERLRGGLRRLSGRLLRGPASRALPPGASLDLLPEARLPRDLAWAAGAPHVAGAVARAATVFDEEARRWAPERVRRLVRDELGEACPPLGAHRIRIADSVEALPPAERPAGRLALLAALASYRTGPADVIAYRNGTGDGQDLVGLVGWAAFTAAGRAVAGLRAAAPAAWSGTPTGRAPGPGPRTGGDVPGATRADDGRR